MNVVININKKLVDYANAQNSILQRKISRTINVIIVGATLIPFLTWHLSNIAMNPLVLDPYLVDTDGRVYRFKTIQNPGVYLSHAAGKAAEWASSLLSVEFSRVKEQTILWDSYFCNQEESDRYLDEALGYNPDTGLDNLTVITDNNLSITATYVESFVLHERFFTREGAFFRYRTPMLQTVESLSGDPVTRQLNIDMLIRSAAREKYLDGYCVVIFDSTQKS